MTKYSLASRLGAFLVAAASILPLASCDREYVPYVLVTPTKREFRINYQENDSGGIFQEGDTINYIPKLRWDTNKPDKINILYTNSTDDARFTPEEIKYMQQFYSHIRINGKKLEVQINPLSNLELKGGISFQNRNELLGAITIVPTNFLEYINGRVGEALALDIDGNGYLDSGIIRLKDRTEMLKYFKSGAGDNPYLHLHELLHLFDKDKEPTKEEQKQLQALAEKIQQWINKKQTEKLVINN